MKKLNALFMLVCLLACGQSFADAPEKQFLTTTTFEWSDTINLDELRNWRQENAQRLNDSLIYLPTTQDAELLIDLFSESGSGFGPGNGGSDLLFEVDDIAKNLLATVSLNQSIFHEVNVTAFEKALKETLVFFVEKLPTSNGRYVQALNWKEQKLILIKKDSWHQLLPQEKRKLIFHEYLGILGLEENNTYISNRLDLKELQLPQSNKSTWNGQKYFYSSSNTNNYVIKLTLEKNSGNGLGAGKLVTRLGSSQVNYLFTGDTLNINLNQKLSEILIGYFTTNSGIQMSVDVIHTLKSIHIIEEDGLVKHIDQNWEICDDKNSVPTEYQDEVRPCFNEIKKIKGNFLSANIIKAKSFDLSGVNLFALPTRSTHLDSSVIKHSIIEKKDFTLNVIKTSDDLQPIKIHSLIAEDKKISLNYQNGLSITYKKIKSHIGFDRVISEFNDNGHQSISMDALVLSDGLVKSLRKSDLIGDYVTQYSNARHTSEDSTTYNFYADGTGGFMNDFVDSSFYSLWEWTLKDGIITADRFLNPNFGPVSTREQLKECHSTADLCYKHQSRDYYILKRKGHRFTMLRYMTMFYTDGTQDIRGKESSLWVFDKY